MEGLTLDAKWRLSVTSAEFDLADVHDLSQCRPRPAVSRPRAAAEICGAHSSTAAGARLPCPQSGGAVAAASCSML
eukprot:3237201-Pyramimonas_sp.AAC.1